ncbi:MAG: phosphoenolpyruvate synthase [Deltaproteobacteria bacterium]|nr:phosphoenolpyruvate synthase [Deltaproteobacteria bacterium]
MGKLKDLFRPKNPGPHPNRKMEEQLRQKYGAFRKLLADNQEVLEIITDLEEKYAGDYIFDMQYLRANIRKLSEKVYSLIHLLNEISNLKYGELYRIHEQIYQELSDLLAKKRKIPVDDLVLSFDRIALDKEESVGGKMANLGELRNRLGLPVPEGFAITAYTYKAFIDYHHLQEEISSRLNQLDINNLEDLIVVSRDIQQLILEKPLPPFLTEILVKSYQELTEKAGREVRVAVRSSALGEDSRLSFAGQYGTILNVSGENIGEKYKEIVASKFTPRAIFYFIGKGFREEDIAMGMGCMMMVPAKAGGVIYTVDPGNPQRPEAVIHAHWGLGKTVVDGTVTPDIFWVSKEDPFRVVESSMARKEKMVIATPEGGIGWAEVPQDLQEGPCLSEKLIGQLGRAAGAIEDHFGHPQDIEWALDEEDRIYFLQTRPLKVFSQKKIPSPQEIPELSQFPVLLETGVMGAQGVGSGPVFLANQERDLVNFPAGGILVARTPSPKWVTVMSKARGIITDLGSSASHMAALAREFRVPTILNTQKASEILAPGLEVTVDATHCRVYQGRIEKLIEYAEEEAVNPFEDTPLFVLFDKILTRIVPLNLVDPTEPDFTPAHCRTFHDITRFTHQTATQEMFSLSTSPLTTPGEALRLDTDTPLEILLIDLGGGINPGFKGKKVKLNQILSWPMQAFWQGVQSMKWPGPKPLDMKGFASVVAQTAAEPGGENRIYSEKSYALLSRDYLNFSIRLGYHLSTIEVLGGSGENENYINFILKGGGATIDRRDRRARLVATILEKLGFQVGQKLDLVDARLIHHPREAMEKVLYSLGKLTVYTKQLDMVMFNEAIVEWSIEEFVKEHLR